MKRRFKILALWSLVLFIQLGCTVKWTEAIHYGQIAQKKFSETIDLEVENGLIFLPVKINGTVYRFLFDSGAPFSISNELQLRHSFKTVSKGNIIDSDHNRNKVNWVKIDSTLIGSVSFLNQTAFVGDFNANPVLKCLNIDGIVGSNIMRHCNWTINQVEQQLTLKSSMDKAMLHEPTSIPFKTDLQYNMFINVNFGQALVKNILVDYGSNGSVALSKDIFDILKERSIIDQTFKEEGVQQTGIIGKPIDFSREITISDSVSISNLRLNNIELKTGKTNLIGNKVLSKFIVTIDWDNKNLHLVETKLKPGSNDSFGFRIGFTNEKGVYIQSVLKNSIAYKNGIRPNMKVAKVDTLDFENGSDFCDYVKLKPGNTVFLELVDSNGQKQQFQINKTTLNHH